MALGARRAARPRRLAADPLLHRPGAALRGVAIGRPGWVRGVGRAAAVRDGAGPRTAAARSRRPRGADHDDPRGEGARVPDHGAVRAHDANCRPRAVGFQVHWDGDEVELSSRKDVATSASTGWPILKPRWTARRSCRLLYVACTRARDHLLVATHHIEGVEVVRPARVGPALSERTAGCWRQWTRPRRRTGAGRGRRSRRRTTIRSDGPTVEFDRSARECVAQRVAPSCSTGGSGSARSRPPRCVVPGSSTGVAAASNVTERREEPS